MKKRDLWATRIGVVLAMAGNAIGLGNFLRFPVQAAQNGGGAFMIPYFLALLLMGIPLMWCEWAMGRYGGAHHHGTAPGVFALMSRRPAVKYLGLLGIILPLGVTAYYVYVESWTLAFSAFSLCGSFPDHATVDGMKSFLKNFQGAVPAQHPWGVSATAYGFFLLTLGLNYWVLSGGIARDIERLAMIGMPVLFVFALMLMIRVFTLGAPDPARPQNNVINGFGFLWNPTKVVLQEKIAPPEGGPAAWEDRAILFGDKEIATAKAETAGSDSRRVHRKSVAEQLSNAKVWLAAAGQVFFTLSLGFGAVLCYASYLRRRDDIVVTALSTSMTNEFVEVIFGASIAIPVAFAFFGGIETVAIAKGGSFDLAFAAMPVIFQKLTGGPILGFMWFFLLFIAGITSSVALTQPAIAFLEDELGWSHRKAVRGIGVFLLVFAHVPILGLRAGALDQLDFWAGTVGLALFALIECIMFMWVFGADRAWEEMHHGAEVRIPRVFFYILKYVTPVFLGAIFIAWIIQTDAKTWTMAGATTEQKLWGWAARLLLVGMMVAVSVMIRRGGRRKGTAS